MATYAAALAAVPSYRPDLGEAWDIAKIYWVAIDEGRFRATLRRLREEGDTETFEGMDPDGDFGAFDHSRRARQRAHRRRPTTSSTKLEALRRHRSQVKMDGPFFSGAENGQSMWGEEFYRIAKGPRGPLDDDGWESDLFAGL